MKRFKDSELSFSDLKNAIGEIKKSQDKKNFYIFIGITVTLLTAIIAAIIWFSQKETEADDDWEDDWEDEDFEGYDDEQECNENECCCTDKDIDKSVKVEKL